MSGKEDVGDKETSVVPHPKAEKEDETSSNASRTVKKKKEIL
jgi:hypothetical protein